MVDYFTLVTAVPEKDPQSGHMYVIAKISNPTIRELKTAMDRYITFKTERYNETDASDVREMKVSNEIRDQIHEIWKILNPS
jgi:hypothetical protein